MLPKNHLAIDFSSVTKLHLQKETIKLKKYGLVENFTGDLILIPRGLTSKHHVVVELQLLFVAQFQFLLMARFKATAMNSALPYVSVVTMAST